MVLLFLSLTDVPYRHGRGHWTRDVVFSAEGKILFVAVGSGSNVDDPDTNPAERNRADILAFHPDGSRMRVYASGIRNPSGLPVDPRSGQLWCAVNERDGVITPEVLLQPHSAPLQLAFYQGEQFPDEYRGDIFASFAWLLE
jgi:glucose/arabinose dehydrogenase